METWEVIGGILTSTSALENPKTQAILYFMKQTTWSLWSVFGTREIDAIWDEL